MADPLDAAIVLLREAGVRLAILFGSRARGDARADSDWDVGVIGASDREALQARLSAILGADVDLVDLRRASPLLCDRAMREGRVLFDADGSEYARFASLTLRRYADTEKLRRAQAESLREFTARYTR